MAHSDTIASRRDDPSTQQSPSTSWPEARRLNWVNSFRAILNPAGSSDEQFGSIATFFDEYARPFRVRDRGNDTTTADHRTTCTAYTPVSATGTWITNAIWKTALIAGSGTSQDCSTYPEPSTWLSGSTNRYDQNTTPGAEATHGRPYQSLGFVRRGDPTSQWPTETYSYNTKGQFTQVASSTGGTTDFSYDAWGHVVNADGPFAVDTVVTATDPAWGHPTSITNPAGDDYTLVYDALGRPKTVTRVGAAQPSYRFSYTFATTTTPARTVTEVLRTPGGSFIKTAAFHDGFGRNIQNQVRATNGTTLESVDRTIYGNLGQSRIQIMPVSSGNTFGTFWAMPETTDRTITEIDDRGDQTTQVYNANTVELTNIIETRGARTTTVSAGQTGSAWRDFRGNTVQSRNDAGQDTTIAYNLRDQATLVTGPGPNPSVVSTSYGTNWQTSPVSLTDSSLGTVGYGYDNDGRLTSQTDGDGNNLHINYGIGSLPQSVNRDSLAGPVVSSWIYDTHGRVDVATHNNLEPSGAIDTARIVTTDYGFNPRGELASLEHTIPGLGSQTLGFAYREAGGLDTVTYPNGDVSTFGFDDLERQTSLSHDGINGVIQLADLVTYTDRGQVDFISYGAPGTDAGFDIDYTYDDWSGRIDTMLATAQGGGIVQNLDFDWATNGNLDNVRDNAPGVNQLQCFTYDNKNQLATGYTTNATTCTGANSGGPDPYTVGYTYHPNGNIDTATGTGTPNATYNYGAGTAGPHAVTSAGSNSYTYSPGGLMETRTVGGATSQLNYDVQNRLIGISGQTNMDALYAADGSRVKRTLDDPATTETESVSYYVGDSYEVVHTPIITTTTTTQATTTTTQPTTTTTQATTTTTQATTTTTAGGTKTVTVRARSYWQTAYFDLEANGVIAGSDSVATGSWQDRTFTVPASTGIGDLRVLFSDSPDATLGVFHVIIDGVTHLANGPDVLILGRKINGTCEPADYYEFRNIQCTGWFDFSGVGGGGTTTTTQPTTTTTQPTTTTTQATTTTTQATTTTTAGGTKTVTVRARSYWQTAYFDLEADGVIVGSDSVATGSWQDRTFTVPASTGIGDLRVLFSDSPDATLGVFHVIIDGVTHLANGPDVLILGRKIDGTCQPADYYEFRNIQCTGWFDFSALTPPAGPTIAAPEPGLFFTAPIGYDETIRIHHTIAGHRIGTTTDSTFTAALTDHLGSNTANRDTTGLATVQRYTPFGVIRGAAGNGLDTDHTYTGQTNDPGTGLIDYNARHYDPQLGRFIQADTVLDGLNRYSYVRNNPLNATDPTGHCGDYETDGEGGYTCTFGSISGGGWTVTFDGGTWNSNGSGFSCNVARSTTCGPSGEAHHPTLIDACVTLRPVDCAGATLHEINRDWGFGGFSEAAAGAHQVEGELVVGPNDSRRTRANLQNALRHSTLLVLLTIEYGETNARTIAWAHEPGPISTLSSSDHLADIHNNEVGIQIAQDLGQDATLAEIEAAVFDALGNGELQCWGDMPGEVRTC